MQLKSKMLKLGCAATCAIAAFSPSVASANGVPMAVLAPASLVYSVSLLSSSAMCVTYSYDANGNRTTVVTGAAASGTVNWGSEPFGCFEWN